MNDFRSQIQDARFQDDVDLWAALVEELMKTDVEEGMKAALSGSVRSSPGSKIKARSVSLIVAHATALAEIDPRAAVEAAISASIGSKPDSDERRQALAFITGQTEALSKIDFQFAVRCADFAVKWAIYDAELAREAGEVHERLVAREEDLQQAAALASHPETGTET